MKAIPLELENLVETTAIVQWQDVEVTLQKQIAQAVAPGTIPGCLVYPTTQEELAQVIACAHRNNWGILPCGSGSKLGWGGVAKDINLVISTARLNRIVEHAVGDLTVTVEAGVKFSDLQTLLAQTHQFLALDPAYPETATIGGIIATADAGSWRHRYGGVRDMVLGVSFVRADGELAKAGGRVVKNVAGYDLMKLLTGSYGTLGIISQVTLRLYPMQEASETVVLSGEAEALAQATQTLLASALTPSAVDLLSTKVTAELGVGKGIGLMVRFQSVPESVKEQSARLLDVGQHLGLQGSQYSDTDERHLWKQLPEQIWETAPASTITCKIGVLPTAAVSILSQLDAIAPQSGKGLIHAGSGLGLLRFAPDTCSADAMMRMRSLCQDNSGFLSVLEAPLAFKQQLDVWGYSGNALELMRKIKTQFDPKNLLNPHRFVGGI